MSCLHLKIFGIITDIRDFYYIKIENFKVLRRKHTRYFIWKFERDIGFDADKCESVIAHNVFAIAPWKVSRSFHFVDFFFLLWYANKPFINFLFEYWCISSILDIDSTFSWTTRNRPQSELVGTIQTRSQSCYKM